MRRNDSATTTVGVLDLNVEAQLLRAVVRSPLDNHDHFVLFVMRPDHLTAILDTRAIARNVPPHTDWDWVYWEEAHARWVHVSQSQKKSRSFAPFFLVGTPPFF